MTSRQRWLLSSCLLAVFFIASLVYVFWIPYDSAALYRAIPSDAALVSSHRNLAQRWPQLVTNIWLSPFIGAVETTDRSHNAPGRVRQPVGPSQDADESGGAQQYGGLPRLERGPALALRLMRLARRDTIIAYLPAPGGAGKPTWIAASWIGGWSPYVRWALSWSRRPGIKELGTFGGRTMWGLPTPLADGRRLSFACGEGVLMACLSADPTAIRFMLMAYDGLIPSFQIPSDWPMTAAPLCPDIAWCRWRSSAHAEPCTLTGILNRFDDQGLSATIRLRPSPFRQTRLADCIHAAEVKQALGNLPALVLALPLPAVQDKLLATATDSAWLQTIRRMLLSDWIQQDANGLVLALFTGEYGGGYGRSPWRMSIPALMAFIRVRQPDTIRRVMDRELDLLNARHRLGLIQDPTPLTVASQSVWTIESTSSPALANLDVEDRPAYTLVGDWLIISSQAGSLAKLMRRLQASGNDMPPAPARWHGALSATNTSALAWLDLDAGGKNVQLALSLWGLSRHTADPDSLRGRDAIIAIRTLLDRIRPLQSCLVWMEPEGSNAIVRVEIGPQAEP